MLLSFHPGAAFVDGAPHTPGSTGAPGVARAR